MLKRLMLILVLMALVPGLAVGESGKSGERKRKKNAEIEKAKDPADADAVTCGYTSRFQSTLKALTGDHFQKLMITGNPSASSVIEQWARNLGTPAGGTDDADLQGKLVTLGGKLAGKYSFRDLIIKRLTGELHVEQPSINTDIDTLVTWGFAFTLFDRNAQFGSPELRVQLAKMFAKGRFNIHSWNDLYTKSNYNEADYEESDIVLYIELAQAHGIIPAFDTVWGCWKSVGGKTIAVTAAANDKCCCNTSTHSTFRKCRLGNIGQNCTPDPPANCYLASQNCSAHAAH